MRNGVDRKQILVIDKEDKITKFISRILRDEYTVFATHSGYDGLQRVKQRIPDLVLLGLNLSGLRGMEVLKNLKELETEIPVIVMTTNKRVKDAVQAIELGATFFITKPFDIETLRKYIENLFYSHKRPSQGDLRFRRISHRM